MSDESTAIGVAKEPQNQVQFDRYHANAYGAAQQLGPYTAHIWMTDPRHLGFLLARYKFVAKMLEGRGAVLEVGCGDGFGIPVVCQAVGRVHGVDFEPLLMEDNARRLASWQCDFAVADLTREVPQGRYEAAYSLDVIEHVASEHEDAFIANICAALDARGVLIVGTPNLTAEAYASEGSRAGHINLKGHRELRALLARHFDNVFMFSMNDEMVHTGHPKMAWYYFIIAMMPSVIELAHLTD